MPKFKPPKHSVQADMMSPKEANNRINDEKLAEILAAKKQKSIKEHFEQEEIERKITLLSHTIKQEEAKKEDYTQKVIESLDRNQAIRIKQAEQKAADEAQAAIKTEKEKLLFERLSHMETSITSLTAEVIKQEALVAEKANELALSEARVVETSAAYVLSSQELELNKDDLNALLTNQFIEFGNIDDANTSFSDEKINQYLSESQSFRDAKAQEAEKLKNKTDIADQTLVAKSKQVLELEAANSPAETIKTAREELIEAKTKFQHSAVMVQLIGNYIEKQGQIDNQMTAKLNQYIASKDKVATARDTDVQAHLELETKQQDHASAVASLNTTKTELKQMQLDYSQLLAQRDETQSIKEPPPKSMPRMTAAANTTALHSKTDSLQHDEKSASMSSTTPTNESTSLQTK